MDSLDARCVPDIRLVTWSLDEFRGQPGESACTCGVKFMCRVFLRAASVPPPPCEEQCQTVDELLRMALEVAAEHLAVARESDEAKKFMPERIGSRSVSARAPGARAGRQLAPTGRTTARPVAAGPTCSRNDRPTESLTEPGIGESVCMSVQ